MSGSAPGGDVATTFAESEYDRFTAWLQARAEPDWSAAVDHRFVEALAADELDPAVFRRYLVQDVAFVDTLATVVGYAVAQAPNMSAKGHLATFLATLTADEDDYFERAFAALGVTPDARRSGAKTAVTEAFEDLLLRAARGGTYAETLAVLLPVEWVYLAWAQPRAAASPSRAYLAEWIDLHTAPAFEAFVEWLRTELDGEGAAAPGREQRRLDRHFRRAVGLEVAFFESAYESANAV